MKTKRFLSLLLCILMVLSLLPTAALAEGGEVAVQTDGSDFADLPETDALYPSVRYLAYQGIMEGFPDGTFQPAAALTRAKAAKAAVLCKKLAPVSAGSPTFPDVPAGYWAYSYIETAAKAELIKGYPGGAFKPDEPITKAEAVTLLLRLSGGALSDETVSIADVAAGSWAYKPAVTAVEAGLSTLSSDQLFGPDTPFTRGEFAWCLSALFTLGPALREADLIGKLSVTKGEAAVSDESGTRSVKTETTVNAGMTISTDSQSRAEITFDDGSGILIEPETQISVVRSEGFNYMRPDGMPAVAIDRLEIKMNKGSIFSVLADRREGSEVSGSQIAATDQTWWLYPYSKRERITVEMPAGVVGIRGSLVEFHMHDYYHPLPATAVLIGAVRVTSGGETVSLVGGQATTVPLSPAGGSAASPSAPVPLSTEQTQAFLSVSDWIMGRAQDIQVNAPTPPPQQTGSGAGGAQPPDVPSVIGGALDQLSAGSTDPISDPDSGGDPDPGPTQTAPTIGGGLNEISLLDGYGEFHQDYVLGGLPSPDMQRRCGRRFRCRLSGFHGWDADHFARP